MANDGDDRLRNVLIGLAALGVVAIIAVVALVVLGGDDDEEPPATTTTPETTEAPPETTTSTPETTTTTEETEGGLPLDEAGLVVWPDPASDVRYAEAQEAAQGFAEELVGFTDPIYGELREGDAGSGEVPVRPLEDGPETIVLVRQLSDDNWWVIGAVTDQIQLEEPLPGSAIVDPVFLFGQASAFEGTVQVSILRRGDTEPVGEGVVTGSGTEELGPFEGEVSFEDPGEGAGVVMLYVLSAEDGSVWQATAIPVSFVGGQ